MIHQSDQPGRRRAPISRTLPTRTECFSRHERRHRVLELSPKPKDLPEGSVDQRSWKQYQSYLSRVRPVARAEFYKRLMERQGLKILDLREPVLGYLRTQDSPAVVGYFREGRLRELSALQDPRRIWQRFKEMLCQLGIEAEPETP